MLFNKIKNNLKRNKVFVLILGFNYFTLFTLNEYFIKSKNIESRDSNNYEINEIFDSPLIFIGGYARSGTTLIRAILDVHESVSCGPEKKILPVFLSFLTKYMQNFENIEAIKNAKLKNKTITDATGLFIYHIMRNHIRNSERLCAKDPDILYYIEYLHNIFPKSKFIFMIRDPRAVVYSLMNRLNEDVKSNKVYSYLSTWNYFNINVKRQCDLVGQEYCKLVRYEDLILNTNSTLRSITNFLNLTWTNDFLNHTKYFGSRIIVSDTEWSTNQIKNQFYKKSLYEWIGKLKYDKNFLKSNEFFLNELGYSLDEESIKKQR